MDWGPTSDTPFPIVGIRNPKLIASAWCIWPGRVSIPKRAVGFWQRFAEYNKASGSGTPWFLRTHPLDETRIKRIQEWLPQAKQQYRKP
jgi:hypothetical protein